jgi:hypothetical protein
MLPLLSKILRIPGLFVGPKVGIGRREKARTLVGDGALPFEATVEPLDTGNGKPGVHWTARDLKPPIFQQAAELFSRGLSVRQVKLALGISHGEAGRLRLRAAAEGLLEPGREDDETEEGEEADVAPDGPFRLN